MPKKNNHRFIDKKNAVTFKLVHRSQRDPLIADEDAPQHVLVEQGVSNQDRRLTEQPSSSATNSELYTSSTEKRKIEQRTYGIFYDDDYDYLQHLKDVREVAVASIPRLLNDSEIVADSFNKNSKQLVLPSSVFASNVEEEIGLLNRGAPVRGPRPDWDPDIVAALDDGFCNNEVDELEDDFIVKANEALSDESCSEDENSGSYDSVDERSDENYESDEPKEFLFEKEETKSRFTNYSLTSSVLPRNKGLTLVDDQFEKMYEEYDDDQIGALDGDESYDGFIRPGNQILENAIQEFKQTVEQSKINLADVRNEVEAELYESSTDEEAIEVLEGDGTTKWDCESIISTYSTLYNHPKIIEAPSKIKVSSFSIPKEVLNPRGLTKSALQRLDKLDETKSSSFVKEKVNHGRPISETPEEKKERKQAIKQQRRERRLEKKMNVNAFKEEKKRQTQCMLNLRENVKGIKLT